MEGVSTHVFITMQGWRYRGKGDSSPPTFYGGGAELPLGYIIIM